MAAYNAGSAAGAQRNIAPPAATSWSQGVSNQPVPPYQPLCPSRFQAGFTTYPSRLKAGTTTLLAPSGDDGSYSNAHGSRGLPDVELSRASSSRTGRRTTTRVVYREASDEEELNGEDDGDGDSEEEEEDDNQESQQQQGPEPVDRPGTWLGRPLPANKTSFQTANLQPYSRYNSSELAATARVPEVLLPIKVDLEAEGYLLRDMFTWNKNEPLLSPLTFARRFLRDLDLPYEPYAEMIASSIRQQVEEADTADFVVNPAPGGPWATRYQVGSQEYAALPKKEKRKDARRWDWGLDLQAQKPTSKRRRIEAPSFDAFTAEEAEPDDPTLQADNVDVLAHGEVEDDLRVMVSYEVQILRDVLRDRVEWDLASPLAPEDFASGLCRDLGLTGEALPLIANAVREELSQHKRAVMEQYLLGSGAQYLHAKRGLDQAILEEREERIEYAASKKRAELFGLATPDGPGSQAATPTPGPSGIDSPALPPAIPEKRGRGRPPKYPRASGGDDVQPAVPLLLGARRRKEAEAGMTAILNRTSKPLQDIWRDWADAKESGPSLERLSADDLERMAHEQLRAARRGKREQARAAPARRRR